MPFAIGSAVVVTSLGKTGRVVEAARNGRYRVRVGGVVVMCREDELAGASAGDRKRGRKKGPSSDADANQRAGLSRHSTDVRPIGDVGGRRGLGSIDLHGLTVEEAVRDVEERIDLALRAGVERLEIIHGRSSGRIKIAVHRLLGQLTAVRHFEVDPKNPGATIVHF